MRRSKPSGSSRSRIRSVATEDWAGAAPADADDATDRYCLDTDWRLLRRVMSRPAVCPGHMTRCLLVSLCTWNEVLIPLFVVSGESLRLRRSGWQSSRASA